ncbi:MAG: DUF393 domain-containing protein [Ignavibacteriaceae bacterium]|nr:DUF393 domain-containing protein [Ignavibacteriaceae bacterium]
MVFYDGVCRFCNFWVNRIIKADPEGKFSFTPIQSEYAKSFFSETCENPETIDAIYYFNGKEMLHSATAVIEILKELRKYRLCLGILRFIPSDIINYGYRFIAKTRYSLFGRLKHCPIPQENIKSRFLI